MDDVLARLCELSDAPPSSAVAIEAQHLWKTLETLVATLKPSDLRVHDAAFSRLLACVQRTLKDASVWRAAEDGESEGGCSVHEAATRVLVKIGCRGEDEREAILREGAVSQLVETLRSGEAAQMTTGKIVSALHVFQTLAFDTKRRIGLIECGTVPVVLAVMRNSVEALSVQLVGCKFLQYMAYEEATKDLIIQNHGITVILVALKAFSDNEQLATSASDLLYFLSIDLETALAQHESKFVASMEAITENVIALMRKHPNIQQIQAHGVATLLTFTGSHASARLFLSNLAHLALLWEVCVVAMDSNEDAAADTIELLEGILETQGCYDILRAAIDSHNDASGGCRILESLTSLMSRLESRRGRSQWVGKARAIGFLHGQLGSIVEGISTQRDSQIQPDGQSVTETQDENSLCLNADHTSRLKQSGLAPSLLLRMDQSSGGDREEQDDSNRFLDQDSPEKGHSSYGYFDQFVQEFGPTDLNVEHVGSNRRDSKHIDEDNAGPTVRRNHEATTKNWQQEYKRIRTEFKDLEDEYQVLQHNYQIVIRRAQEQSKLLNIQNSRLKHHMETHQHVLEQVKTLEKALEDAQRKHQVERELRLAEVAQSEKISLSLHEAMKEISTLNKQNSNTSRELQEKEKLRVDIQQKASAVRQQQQKLEYERNDAVTQMLYMRNEQLELNKQLEETRREANEALLMREEDVNAPKLSAFSEMLCLSPSARLRKVSSYTLTTKRVTAEATERQLRHQEHRKSMYAGSISRVVRPADASAMRKASIYSGQVISDRSDGSANILAVNEITDNEDDNYTMEPPKEEDFRGSGTLLHPRQGIDKFDIERTLRLVYEGFDKSPDCNGVHLATIRRFFNGINIVQPPLVPGDVDTILTRVLNQAHENRKRVIARKDFTVSAFPGGVGSSSGIKKANDAKRFRYFDEESFFEAVTLLVMRRFPCFEAKKALEVFITDYIHPMQRQQQQQQLLLQWRSSTSTSMNAQVIIAPIRSGSMSAAGSTLSGNSSPTAACIGILKAILNGLALHVGQDESTKSHDPRYHSKHENNSILLAASQQRKPRREDIMYSMLEMHSVLAREYKPLATICEFYSTMHHIPRDLMLKDEAAMPLTFELLLTFAMDFEIIPSFMDRLSLKHLHSEVSGYLKTYMTLQKKSLPSHSIDTELLKKVTFSMVLARLAMELFSTKREYETPEKQITALLQWLDNSVGRDKIQKKAMLPVVIKFSRKLYAIRS